MKRSPAYLILILLAGLLPAETWAQQRIAYIDSDFIMDEMPEYSGILQRLETIVDNWKEEIDELQSEIEQMKSRFEARELLMTPEVRRQRELEIDQKIREREQLIDRRFGPDGDYFRQQQTLLEPLQQRILDAVVSVAERENYDHVFDRAGDYLFLYSRQRWNISRDVLEEMGIFIEDDRR
ncbi:OmpH family outer membrane protein [Balneolaceae bacterium ANBcel3]|nr:OmpH family outer membrane protein [Balneolaceae bacterium ANBcel3]